MRKVLVLMVLLTATVFGQVAVSPMINPHVTFFDASGNPLSGGKLYSYIAGTSTPQNTYLDSTGVTPNSNPVVLDSSGSANVLLKDASYKFILKTSAGVTLWTVDGIKSLAGAPFLDAVNNFTAANSFTGGLNAKVLNGSIVSAAMFADPKITNAYNYVVSTLSGAGTIFVPCGTYADNVTITTSNVKIVGANATCVHLQPSVLGSPVIKYQTTSTGGGGIAYNELSDVSIECPNGSSCTSDGINFSGSDPSDWALINRVWIYGVAGTPSSGFQNCININGRTIWTNLDNVHCSWQRGDGLHSTTSAAVNQLKVTNSQFEHSFNYGINIAFPSAAGLNLTFENVNAENNGKNTALASCADAYFSNVGSVNIIGGYYESGCSGNLSANPSEIRITGANAQSVNIIGATINPINSSTYHVMNDATFTTGVIEGNRGDVGKGIIVSTTSLGSNVRVGQNYGILSPTITTDANGNSHVYSMSPFVLPRTLTNTATFAGCGGTINLTASGGSAAISEFSLTGGPCTISNITGGVVGQYLFLHWTSGAAWTITNVAGGSGQITLADGANRTMSANADSLLLHSDDGTNWIEVNLGSGAVKKQVAASGSWAQFSATLTTTASTSDVVAMTGSTTSSKCSLAATNATAATNIATTYISTKSANSVTVTHTATAAMTYDILCTVN